MKAWPRPACGVALLLGAAPSWSPAAAQEAAPRFRSGAEVVVLDIVVRDGKGRTVRDLAAGDLTVLEDGAEQQILSFRLRAADEAPVPSPQGPGEGAAPGRRQDEPGPVNLVTLVFDQLGPDGRRVARRAGLALAGLTAREGLLVSVFQVRESLGLVQQFTSERALVEAAVRKATGEVEARYTNATEGLQEAAAAEADVRRQLDSMGSVSSFAEASRAASLGREADVARMAVDALRFTQTLQREQQGHSSLFSLLALSRQQQRLAGRKTILFFSEGIQVPPSLEHVLRAAISEANRANVSVYAVDARGLTDTRRFESTRQTLEQAAAASQRQMASGGIGAVTREEVFALETAESALRIDVQGALQDLAEGTGGTLIADTNDVESAIRRAVGDMRGYYEVVYAPTNPEYDGRFRRIEVRTSRSGLQVQARSGYFAVPPGEGTATFPYEVDLLRALRLFPLPEAFTVRALPFRFGPEGEGIRHTLVLEIPLFGIAFEGDPRGGTDRAHFSILAVVRDPTGLVVHKFSEDSPVFLPSGQREALKRGSAVFVRSFAVPPGRYSLETAVVDQLALRYSVRRSTLTIERPPPGLSVSDVALIKRREAIPAGALRSPDPFRQGETRLVPWLSEPRVGPGDSLSVFVVAYPPKASRTDVLLEFVRDGQLVGQSLSELPPPDEWGRAPYVAAVPTGELHPGRYELRLLLKQEGLVAQREAHFVVVEPGS
jgi:VWFA-related protein